MNGSKLPHSLRLVIFFLRLALGLNFFYLGFTTLFDAALGRELGTRSLASLYEWLSLTARAGTGTPQLFFQWAFLVIGAALILGLFTRFMSIAGIVLTLAGYLPTLNYAALSAAGFANDEILVVICLLVLIFSNAGAYLGLDTFIHIQLFSRRKK